MKTTSLIGITLAVLASTPSLADSYKLSNGFEVPRCHVVAIHPYSNPITGLNLRTYLLRNGLRIHDEKDRKPYYLDREGVKNYNLEKILKQNPCPTYSFLKLSQ